jgi:hypothetical protein
MVISYVLVAGLQLKFLVASESQVWGDLSLVLFEFNLNFFI